MAPVHELLSFEISVVPLGRTAQAVTVAGELDLHVAHRLEACLDQAAREATHVLVDLTRLAFIDSVGVATLLTAARRLRGGGGEMMLVLDDPRWVRLLEVTGLTQFFEIRRDRAAGARDLLGHALLATA